jgi:hypothetical protein
MASLSAGCGDDETRSPEPKPKPGAAAFQRQAEPVGPRIWLDAASDEDGRMRIEVHGAELGDVFGWAAHVRHDAAAFTVEAGSITETLGAATEAVRFVSLGAGDAALGAARRGAALGPVPVEAPALLAVLEIGEPRGSTEVMLDRVVVRRADGSWVDVATAGGLLTEGGAP